MLDIDVTGVNQTLRELRRYEPELAKALKADMVLAARPLAGVVGGAFPSVALSRWVSKGRSRSRFPGYGGNVRGGVKPVVGVGKHVVLRIVQKHAGGAVFESAGSRSSSMFVQNLDKKFGWHSTVGRTRSRVMFAAVKKNVRMIEAAMREVIGRVDEKTSERLSGF